MRLTAQDCSLPRRWQALLLYTLVAASGTACGEESGGREAADSQCAVGQDLCNGICVSLQSDPLNCGACGALCDEGSYCSGGVCVAQCAAGETECGASCVDISVDPSHCGGCNQPCSAG